MFNRALSLIILLWAFVLTSLTAYAQVECVSTNTGLMLGGLFADGPCVGASNISITGSTASGVPNCTNCGTGTISMGSDQGSFTVTDVGGGCSVVVHVLSTDFSAVAAAAPNCNSFAFTADNPLPGATYLWTFPNGSTASGSTANYNFEDNQDGIVELEVSMGSCSVSEFQTINLAAIPGATLSSTGLALCNGDDDISVTNTSNTEASNVSYTIDWGDGTAPFSGATFSTLDHTYTVPGYSPLELTVTGANGCVLSTNYDVFLGANPAGGISSPGATTGLCAPTGVEVSLNGVAGNTPGTVYTLTLSDGSDPVIFSHPPPTSYIHDFNSSSCDFTTALGSQNSFSATMFIENPCGFTNGFIDPIQTSAIPNAAIDVVEPTGNCIGESFTFENVSTGGEIITGSTCAASVNATWSISPTTGWVITANDLNDPTGFSAEFDPGEYTVSMSASNDCGSDDVDTVICVVDPIVTADVQWNIPATACAPFSANSSVNYSTISCESINYSWTASPGGGSMVDNPDTNSPTFSFSEKGEYTLTLVMDNNCGAAYSEEQTITITEPPLVTAQTLTLSACAGSTLAFDPAFCADLCLADFVTGEIQVYEGTVACGTGAASVWTSGAIASLPAGMLSPNCADGGAPFLFEWPVPPAAIGDYTVIMGISNDCGTDCIAIPIEVQSTTPIVVPLPAEVCPGYSVYPELDPEYSGCQWDIGGQIYMPGDAGPYIIDASMDVTITCGSAGCEVSGTAGVDVFAVETVGIAPPDAICSGGSSTLTASPDVAGAQYQWYSGTCAVPIEELTGETNLSLEASSGGDFHILVTDLNGCTSCAETNLIEDQGPTASCVATTLCATDGSVEIDLECLVAPLAGAWDGFPTWTITESSVDIPSVINNPVDPSTQIYTIGDLQAESGMSAGTFIFTWAWTSDAQCTYSDQFDLTIQSTAANFPITVPICQGEVVTLAGGPGGTWDFTSLIAAGVDPTELEVLPGGDLQWASTLASPAGIYDDIIYNDAAGCSQTQYDEIQIMETPESSIMNDAETCIHNDLTLVLDAGIGDQLELFYDNDEGNFVLDPSSGIFNPMNEGVTSTLPGQFTFISSIDYTIAGTIYTCSDASISDLDIYEAPTSQLVPNFCEGLELTPDFCSDPLLTDFELIIGGETYSACPIAIDGLSGTQAYVLTLGYGTGCADQSAGQIEIQEALTYAISTDMDECLPSLTVDIEILTGAVTSMVFSPGGIFTDDLLNQTVTLPVTDPLDDELFSFDITIEDGGCSIQDETVEGEYVAGLSPLVSITNGTTFCSPALIPFDLFQTGSQYVDSVLFTPGDGSPSQIITDFSDISHVYDSPVDSTSFTATFILYNACDQASIDITFVVLPPVFAASVDSPFEICPGEEIDFDPMTVGGLIDQDVIAGPGLLLNLISATEPFVFAVPLSQTPGTYPVDIVLTPSCGSVTTLETEVIVNPNPDPIIGQSLACSGEESTFEVLNPNTNTQYLWTFAGQGGQSGAQVSLVFADAGPQVYTLTAVNTFACETILDELADIPGFNPIAPLSDTTVCGAVELSYSLVAEADQEVTWTVSGNFPGSPIVFPVADIDFNFSSSLDGTTIYDYQVHLLVEEAGLCTYEDSALVQVYPIPKPTIEIALSDSPGFFDPGLTEELRVCRGLSMYYRSAEEYAACQFSLTAGLDACEHVNFCGGTGRICFAEDNLGGYIFLEATNEFQCQGYDSLMVFGGCDLGLTYFAPNAVTADNDGLNDFFKIELSEPVLGYELQIFDRWGQLVFESEDQYKHWNGSVNGSNYFAEDGVYNYKLTLKPDEGDQQVFFGLVTLLR